MPVTTVADMLESLRSLHLLEPQKLAKVVELQAKIPDPQTLAKELIKHGWLTPYQVNQLFQGKGTDLLLGSYILLERLGEGGMGEVYKAKNWKMGRIVALKIIRKDRLLNDNAVRRFHREIKAASTLTHPNIVAALDADQVGKTHLFAMEYVEGTDLAKLVKDSGPMSVAQACEAMRQAALGLEHALEKGLVHRDIKPSNILVTPASGAQTLGQVKILDMGLARTADADETSVLTQEGSVLGTLDFLSPEQAMNAKEADIRSDLYSLGCTFYFVLTGQVPFPGGTATEKLLKHRLEDPEPVEKIRPDVPPQVAAVVRKLMARDPAKRYQKPAELAAALAAGPGRMPAGRKPIQAPKGGVFDVAPTQASDGPETTKTSRSALAGRDKNKKWLMLGIAGCMALGLMCTCLVGSAVLNPNPNSEQARNSGKVGQTAKTVKAEPRYVKMPTREETLLATLKASGCPTLEGKWYYIGYFDDPLGGGFAAVYPPEKEIDLSKSYPGKGGKVSWKEFPNFRVGQVVNLAIMPANQASVIYLYHELETAEAIDLPVVMGADDTLSVWLNGEQLLHHNQWIEKIKPEQFSLTLKLKAGKNPLLLKVCCHLGEYAVAVCPKLPARLEKLFGESLERDFPRGR